MLLASPLAKPTMLASALTRRRGGTGRHGRRLDQPRHGKGTEVVVNGEQALDHPRRGDGAEADVELLGRRAEVGVGRVKIDVPGWSGPLRCLGEEIVEHRLGPGRAGHKKPAATEGGQHRLGDTGHAQPGEGRVEGVAAVTQDLGGGLGGGRMAGGNDTRSYLRCSVRRGMSSTKLHGR